MYDNSDGMAVEFVGFTSTPECRVPERPDRVALGWTFGGLAVWIRVVKDQEVGWSSDCVARLAKGKVLPAFGSYPVCLCGCLGADTAVWIGQFCRWVR